VRQVRMIGVCFGAVLVLASICASAAIAAEPEWGQCYAKAGGKYTNANCTTKGRPGSYEWRKAQELGLNERTWLENEYEAGFPSPTNLAASLTTCQPAEIAQQASCAAGETESTETIDVECPKTREQGNVGLNGKSAEKWAFQWVDCETLGGVECSNTGAAYVLSEDLKGKLGYIDKEQHEVGFTMEPATKGGSIARFTCGGVLSVVLGGDLAKEGAAYPPRGRGDALIVQVSPIDEMTRRRQYAYQVNGQLENLPTHLEGKSEKDLEAYGFSTTEPTRGSKWSKAGISATFNPKTPGAAGELDEGYTEIRG
jgi:hypothetical protein